MSQYTPEKIRQLVRMLTDSQHWELKPEVIITQWLATNQHGPVGLSETQIEELVEYIYGMSIGEKHCKGLYDKVVKGFLNTQTFTDTKEVVVGLSDDQQADFVEYVYRNRWIEIKETLNNWLKSQTFAQQYKTDGFAEMQLEECGIEYRKVKAELEQLKAQPTPNWDNAPSWANWLAQDSDGQWIWYEKEPTAGKISWEYSGNARECDFIKNWNETLQQRLATEQKQEVEVEVEKFNILTLINDRRFTYELYESQIPTGYEYGELAVKFFNSNDECVREVGVPFSQFKKRPNPIQVEVGQVWNYIGKEVYITPTKFTVVDVSEDGVVCEQNPSFMLWKSTLSDFLNKFERASE